MVTWILVGVITVLLGIIGILWKLASEADKILRVLWKR
jgi:uncharacterized membrane protein YbaN (DUF454 family)